MKRRLRRIGALLALFALSAYSVEGARAAVCVPGTDDGAPAYASDAHAGMNHDVPSPSAEVPAPDCPLGMTGMGSSCVAASLPALADGPAPALESSTVELPVDDRIQGSLFTASHFRPPRA